MKYKLIIAVILYFSYSIGILKATSPINDENETFTILNSIQTLKFYEDDGVLKARLESEELIQCNKKIGERFRKLMYFDDESTIEKILLNGDFRTPIISNDLPQNGIFHSDSKLAYVDHMFDSRVKQLKLKTTKEFKDFKFIELLFFQNYGYAVNNSEIHIEIPEYLKCDIEKFHFTNKNITITNKKDGSTNITSFTQKEIPRQKEIKNRPDSRQYLPHLMMLPRQMRVSNKTIELFSDVSKLYDWYYELTTKIGNENTVIKAKVNELVQGKTDDIEKMKAIFYFVQDNIKYIAFEHGIMGFKPEACQNVYKNKFGDCKGMANLLKEMLVLAGFDARLTWLGTIDVPYNYSYPSLYVDNHMICTVKHNDKYYFLDGTEKEGDFEIYADRIQGREVLIEDGKKFIKTTVPIQEPQIHTKKHELKINIQDGKLVGNGIFILKGNSKTNYANYISSASAKDRTDALSAYVSRLDNNFVIKTKQLDLLPKRDKGFELTYDIVADNQVVELGTEKYINMDFDNVFSSVKLEEDRDCPFDIGYRIFESHVTTLEIPANHQVSYLPNELIENNAIGNFKLSIKQDGNSIKYIKEIQLNKTEIEIDDIPIWKSFYAKLKEFYDDRVVLKISK